MTKLSRGCLGLLVASMTATGGCMVGGDEPRLGTSLKAITSAKWVRCWVRPDASATPRDTVECSMATDGPLHPTTVRIRALSAKGGFQSGRVDSDKAVAVARVLRSDFPVSLELTVTADQRDVVTLAMIGPGLTTTLMIPTFDAATIDKPVVMEQPLDVWPIEISVESVFSGTLEAYTTKLPGRVKVAVDPPTSTVSVLPFRDLVVAGEKMTFNVIVGRGDKSPLAGTALFSRNSDERMKFVLDGPGRYIASETGLRRAEESDDGLGTTTSKLSSCPGNWRDDGICDECLGDDPDCRANNTPGCEAQWRGDSLCDPCLGNDPDCAPGGECPMSWRDDGVCDECLGNDPDCAGAEDCPAYWHDDGVCDPCLGNDADCTAGILCPIAWRADGVCDACLGDDPDCSVPECPAEWRGDGVCDACLTDDPDCAGPSCPAEWRGDGICDECLGDDPDCNGGYCPMEWYGDGLCDECLVNDPDCDDGEACPWSWYNDGICDSCLGDDPDCVD